MSSTISTHRWHVKKGGGRFWANGTVTALRDEEGRLRGFAKVCCDLTEQKRAAEATQRLLALLDLGRAMVRQQDGRITFWTKGVQELYGWSLQEAVGRVSHELLKTRFPQPQPDIEAELLRDGRWEGELTHTCPDGSKVVVASHWVLHPDPQGVPATVLEVNNDITGLRASQQALHKLESGLGRLAESGVIGISRGDITGRITDANDAFLHMVGYSREKVRAGKLRWEELTPPEFRHMDERATAELRVKGRCTPFEKELVRRGGAPAGATGDREPQRQWRDDRLRARHHRAESPGGGAAAAGRAAGRGRPQEGRVPGPAGARAAQPAGAPA